MFKLPGQTTTEERRPNAHQRGYTRQWNKRSTAFLKANPLCVMCEAAGRDGVPAEHTDHIIPFKGDLDLRDDPGNWQALCAECHGKKTKAEQDAEQDHDDSGPPTDTRR